MGCEGVDGGRGLCCIFGDEVTITDYMRSVTVIMEWAAVCCRLAHSLLLRERRRWTDGKHWMLRLEATNGRVIIIQL